MSVCRYDPAMLQLFLASALYKDLNSLWMEQIDCHFIITALSGTAAAIILLVFRMQSSIPSKKNYSSHKFFLLDHKILFTFNTRILMPYLLSLPKINFKKHSTDCTAVGSAP